MNNLLIKDNHSSLNLYEKLGLLTEEQLRTIEKGLNWTVHNIPDAVLVGGTATVYYLAGGRDLTPDLDFMVNDTNSMSGKLSGSNISYQSLFVGNDYDLGITVKNFNTDYLDAQKGSKELNKKILETPCRAIIGSYRVKIIQPELLAIMKLDLGRERDINDGFALLGSGMCDQSKFSEYLAELKNAIEDYESFINYEKLIP